MLCELEFGTDDVKRVCSSRSCRTCAEVNPQFLFHDCSPVMGVD